MSSRNDFPPFGNGPSVLEQTQSASEIRIGETTRLRKISSHQVNFKKNSKKCKKKKTIRIGEKTKNVSFEKSNSTMTLTEEIRRCLRMPTFDNWQWEDEEILLLLQQMYVDLDLLKKFDIDLNVLRKFLCQVYMNYNEVPFHNFQHCFTVSQMVSKSTVLALSKEKSFSFSSIDRTRERERNDANSCQPY